MDTSDNQLWETCLKLSTDFEPYGQRKWSGPREVRPDCPACRRFAELFRAWPDWGVCANPESPRAGLLTYRDQGWWQFGSVDGERPEGARLIPGGFKQCFERILREQALSFVLEQVRLANDPLPEEDSPAGPEKIRQSALFIMVHRLLKHADEDFCRRPVEEMAARARWDSSRYWEYARRYWARTFGLDVSAIRLPPNTGDLEEEFWRRVDSVIHEAFREKVKRDE